MLVDPLEAFRTHPSTSYPEAVIRTTRTSQISFISWKTYALNCRLTVYLLYGSFSMHMKSVFALPSSQLLFLLLKYPLRFYSLPTSSQIWRLFAWPKVTVRQWLRRREISWWFWKQFLNTVIFTIHKGKKKYYCDHIISRETELQKVKCLCMCIS